jgi:primosomal protein N' (replication factor Y)
MSQIIQVAVPVPLDGLFDYLCDGEPAKIGARVKVPFQNRELIGVVWHHNSDSKLDPKKIKEIISTVDNFELIKKSQREILEKIANYYQHSLGEVVGAALSGNLSKGKAAELETENKYKINKTPEENKISASAKKQLALYALLEKHPEGITRQHLKPENITTATIQSAVKQGWCLQTEQIKIPGLISGSNDSPPHTLNPQQQVAVTEVTHNLDKFHPSLLLGVTGSGKTEVYLQVMEEVLAQGKQVLFLVPEIGLAPQTLTRVKQRFNASIAVLHSSMTDKERAQSWLAAQQGLVDIVIGTRSSIFTPLQNLGLIIVDEEQDLSYKQQDSLRYHARDVAMLIAQQKQIPIILGSATPSLETLQNVSLDRYHCNQLPKRAGGAKAPSWELVNLQKQPLQNGLSKAALDAIAQHLKQQQQVMIFLNRRGYAPSLNCIDCGWLAECQRCDSRYTLHQFPSQLICHHCDSRRRVPPQCPECGSAEVHPVGLGTERLEQTLSEKFTDFPVIRVDRDSVRRKGEMEQKINQINSKEPAILVGTQMLAKGHHFPAVTLVVIVDTDSMFFSSDFRAMEKGSQLLIQVGGRSGRGEKPGTVMLQTYHADHPLLQTLLTKGYQGFATAALAERQNALLPPFSYMALLRAEAPQPQQVEDMLNQLLANFPSDKKVQLLGPIPAIMLKRQGRFRYQLILQSQQRSALHTRVKQLRAYLNSKNGRKSARNVRWSLDVDPQEMV